jgi:hypothetical protein
MICTFDYAKKLGEAYDSEIAINHAAPLMLSDLWITFVNKKSFLFLNDNLEYSRIIQAEANPIVDLATNSREDEIYTLRDDRKMIKFWKYDILDLKDPNKDDDDNMAGPQAGQQLPARAQPPGRAKPMGMKDRENYSNFLKRLEVNFESEKNKYFKQRNYQLEMSLINKKNIYLTNNLILRFLIAEDLGYLIIIQDNHEICFWNLQTAQQLYKLNPFELKESIVTSSLINNSYPVMSINQEMLYVFDESKLFIYDMAQQQEIAKFGVPGIGKVYGIIAQFTSVDDGLYLITHDDHIVTISCAARKLHSAYLDDT